MRNLAVTAFVTALMAGIAACATAPKTQQDQQNLEADARATLDAMRARDPGLQQLLDASAGYVVLPRVGKGGAIAGGAFGRGVLFENGQATGWVSLSQASLGAQLGGQEFAELIVLEHDVDVQRLRDGRFSLGANASAVAVTQGAAASTRFADGTAVFVMPRGGLMAELSISGQQLNFEPRG
jgi:lipid-binding SYLF domain-containing protein